MLCECLTMKQKGMAKGYVHYEGCPRYLNEYEELIWAYKEINSSYRSGKNTVPEKAWKIIELNEMQH